MHVSKKNILILTKIAFLPQLDPIDANVATHTLTILKEMTKIQKHVKV